MRKCTSFPVFLPITFSSSLSSPVPCAVVGSSLPLENLLVHNKLLNVGHLHHLLGDKWNERRQTGEEEGEALFL